MLGGCERSEGRLIDSLMKSQGDFDFLIVRHTVTWYDDYNVIFYCRSPATFQAERNQFLDAAEPTGHAGNHWPTFRGYSRKIVELKNDIPPDQIKIEVYDKNTVYIESALSMTFDGCRTRVYFNLDKGPRFAETMWDKGIRYPEFPGNLKTPFLQNMKVHEGGGCFKINPEYVDERKQYFYCSSDLGKTWTLETERKQTPPVVVQPAPPPASDIKQQVKQQVTKPG